jgi:uncharacterized protein
MSLVKFRFYATLNDFLPIDKKQICFVRHFTDRTSIKDMIEAIGVPHTEIDLILANGESVYFSYLVQDGDRISVYPAFATIDIASISLVHSPMPAELRFILDIHLGKLSVYLRLLGFDTLYRNDYHDNDLADLSSNDNRILLTRDRGLLKRSKVKYGYWVRETAPERQLVELIRRYDLLTAYNPFQRCLRCNGLLKPVSKEEIIYRLPPKTREFFFEFHICPSCDQIYWKGSHFERMERFIERVLKTIEQLK